MTRKPISTWSFALVVVKSGRKVALVRDSRDGLAWSLPGGRVEEGEDLLSAARRYAVTDAGIAVELEGILRMQYTLVDGGGARLRLCAVARPADDRPLKTIPDENSLAAQWFTREQLTTLTVKSQEVKQFVDLALDGPVFPLSLVTWEE